MRPLRHERGLRRAFTLVELLLVITILALLAALVAPFISGHVESAAEAAALANLEAAQSAVNIHKAREGVWPGELTPEMFRFGDVPQMPDGWSLEYDPQIGVVSLLFGEDELDQEEDPEEEI